MVDVSQNFRTLSQQHGRKVYAKVVAGSETFLDDRLIEFSFDDVTHPDWYTVGTACSNRFHFVARFEGTLPAGAEVKPYISFDGAEWCPLGVFYISRRYIRRGVAQITAYDKLYSLDMDWTYSGGLPVNSKTLLAELCSTAGITAEDYGASITISTLPDTATLRDMIGYIAGLNRACAKLDRYGRLKLKKCDRSEFTISDVNCMDIQRNGVMSQYTAVAADNGSEVIKVGSGSELATLEMYNPMATEDMLNSMLPETMALSYYGAELQMQGLPFLESGELVYVSDRDELYPIIISEIEFYYNGGFYATVHSRNKTNIDALVHEDDLEEELNRLEALFKALSMRFINEDEIVLSASAQVIADFSFKCAGGSFAELHLSPSVSCTASGAVLFDIYINGTRAERVISRNLSSGGSSLAGVYHLEQNLKKGENRIYVTAQLTAGSASIPAAGMLAGLVVHGGISAAGGDIRDRIGFADKMQPITMGIPVIGIAGFQDNLTASTVGGI